MMRKTPLIAAVLIVAASCSADADPKSTPAEPVPVVVLVEAGGCAMMGPNCMTALVWTDGTVDLHRSPLFGGGDPIAELAASEPELVISVPVATVAGFREVAAETDLEGLRARLGPGTCNACVDGIDVTVHTATPDGTFTVSSAQVRFEPSEPFFSALNDLRMTIAAAGELPLVQR